MELQIWSEEDSPVSWLMGLCPRRRRAYLGPYPTWVLPLQQGQLLIVANCWAYVVDVDSLAVLARACQDSEILHVSTGKRMVLVATQQEIHLMSERLETVRRFGLAGRRVLAVSSSNKGFRVMHEGEELASVPLVRFVATRPRALSGYHEQHRLYCADAQLWVENTDNQIQENI